MPDLDVLYRLAALVWKIYYIAIIGASILLAFAVTLRVSALLSTDTPLLRRSLHVAWQLPIHLWGLLTLGAMIQVLDYIPNLARPTSLQLLLFGSLYGLVLCAGASACLLVLLFGPRSLARLRAWPVFLPVADVLVLQVLVFVLFHRLPAMAA